MAVDVARFQLVPDISPLAGALAGLGERRRERRIGNLSQEALDGSQDAIGELIGIDPQAAQNVLSVLQTRDNNLIARAQRETEAAARDASFILGVPDDQRDAAIAQVFQRRQAEGLPTRSVESLMGMDPDEQFLALTHDLERARPASALFRQAGFQRGAGAVIRDADGNLMFATPTFDPTTGEQTTVTSPIPGGLVSRTTGESAPDRRAGQVDAARQIEEIKTEESGARKREDSVISRRAVRIDAGVAASDNIPNLRRSLELLEGVKTGGFDSARIRASQTFGIEGADEAELSQRLTSAAIAQLRERFGAQFTASEGKLLLDIEPGIGKSTEGNIRILRQALRLAERVAKRGIDAAVANEDFETAAEIKRAMDFSLSLDDPLSPEEQAELEVLEDQFGAN